MLKTGMISNAAAVISEVDFSELNISVGSHSAKMCIVLWRWAGNSNLWWGYELQGEEGLFCHATLVDCLPGTLLQLSALKM
jgi:hypothetical protein